MTPKEKAKRLVDQFSLFVTTWNCYYDSPENPDNILRDAKQCALIAVDELVKDNERSESIVNAGLNKEYWQQVKTEIEKL